MPGALLVGRPRSPALRSLGRTARLLHMPIKSPLCDRLDMLLQAGALVGHKDLAGFLLFGASIQLRNGFGKETAAFFGSFGRPIAACGGFRQESDVATAVGGLGIAKVGEPIANGTCRRARIHLVLLVPVGFD